MNYIDLLALTEVLYGRLSEQMGILPELLDNESAGMAYNASLQYEGQRY